MKWKTHYTKSKRIEMFLCISSSIRTINGELFWIFWIFFLLNFSPDVLQHSLCNILQTNFYEQFRINFLLLLFSTILCHKNLAMDYTFGSIKIDSNPSFKFYMETREKNLVENVGIVKYQQKKTQLNFLFRLIQWQLAHNIRKKFTKISSIILHRTATIIINFPCYL